METPKDHWRYPKEDASEKHYYKESNEIVDALAKNATTIQEQKIFMDENELPSEGKLLSPTFPCIPL